MKVDTHMDAFKNTRENPLTDVGDLIEAYKNIVAPRFANTPGDEINLYQMQGGVESEALNSDDSLVDISFGQSTRDSLIIRTLNINNPTTSTCIGDRQVAIANACDKYDWKYLASLFGPIVEFTETRKYYKTDRKFKFKTKSPITCYNHQDLPLMKANIPDLKYQNIINICTPIQKEIKTFMKSSEFLGLLIGPTGCGKTHQMLLLANRYFTIFINAQDTRGSNDPIDYTLSHLKSQFEIITATWRKMNQGLHELRRIAYAFFLSRILFLKLLKERNPGLTPTQFLIYQLTNSHSISACFLQLTSHDLKTLALIRSKLTTIKCLICIDEAHVLASHLDSMVISSEEKIHFQANGDVNPSSKRGTLSVLLWSIQEGLFARKVFFAGTSSKLRNIDNFGTYETKSVHPTTLNKFTAWSPKMALTYISNLVAIDRILLQEVFVDYYRPRILENFVYDLFCIATNDTGSPTKRKRENLRNELKNLRDIISECYKAVIHRFTRISIDPLEDIIRTNLHTQMLIKLLMSSMMTCNMKHTSCHLNEKQTEFFEETIGAVYLVHNSCGYSFFEGYVINAFLVKFKKDIEDENLRSPLQLLQDTISKEGRKTTAKGTIFEAVVLAELQKLNGVLLSEFVARFKVQLNFPALHIPTKTCDLDDLEIISQRPLNLFFRPSNLFGPDIIAFLSDDTLLSIGIKLYTSNIPKDVHDCNLKSTDPSHVFAMGAETRICHKRKNWVKQRHANPIRLAIRFLIELPYPVSEVHTDPIDEINVNGVRNIIIVITKANMKHIFCSEVCNLINCITENS
jgi:hypothetical protein